MITFDEMREKYPPLKVSTQLEFDLRMNAMRREQTDLTTPLKVELESLNRSRHELGRQISQMTIELGSINRRREAIMGALSEVGRIFYGLKKELIQMNPKTVPPTLGEGGEP